MDFSSVKNWHNTILCEKVKDKLEKRGFEALILNSKEEIRAFIDERIPVGSTVGFGGSVTLRELDIVSYIKSKGHTVYDHWEDGLSKEEVMSIIRKQPYSDFFLSSTNAITMDGQIINIDTTGNRVASMVFGPKNVIVFAGVNKISKDYNDAMIKIKNYSCPQNSKRKGLGSPCEKVGYCIDCKDSPASICKITTIIDHKPPTLNFTIILLPQDLGF